MEIETQDTCYYIDFAFVNIASASSLKKSVETILKEREKAKIEKYKSFFSTDQMRFFVPFVLDSAGNLGTLALNFLERLSREFLNGKEVSLKSEVMATLQMCYWEWFYQFKGVYNHFVINPVVRQRNSHDSSHILE